MRLRNPIDHMVPGQGREKTSRLDLGLALLHTRALPGICYTQDEIAAFGGCSRSAIAQIEARAIRKLRRRLGEALPELTEHRS